MSTQEIFGEQLGPDSVGTVELIDGAVTTAKLAVRAVETAQINLKAVTAAVIADGAVGTVAIAAGGVQAANIGASQVTAAKIADGNITTVKLADNAVTATQLANNAVTAGKIASSVVDTTALAPNAVTTTKINDAAVTTAKINAGAVTAASIATGTITNVLLSDGELHFKADTTSLSSKKTIFNLEKANVTLAAGASMDASSYFSTETAVSSSSTTEGVITTTTKNDVTLKDSNLQPITDGSNHEVYGRLTYNAGVWTLTYYVLIAGSETAYNLPGALTGAKLLAPKRYNLNIAPEEFFRKPAAFSNNVPGITEHINQATGAHAATAISLVDSGNHFSTKNVEAALAALAGPNWAEGSSLSLQGHLATTTAAHAATAISFIPDTAKITPLTGFAEVNSAIEELHRQIEILQAQVTPALFGYLTFVVTDSGGKAVFDIPGATANAPYVPGNNSLSVYRNGVLQSREAGHYSEASSGLQVTLSTAAPLNARITFKWWKRS